MPDKLQVKRKRKKPFMKLVNGDFPMNRFKVFCEPIEAGKANIKTIYFKSVV